MVYKYRCQRFRDFRIASSSVTRNDLKWLDLWIFYIDFSALFA